MADPIRVDRDGDVAVMVLSDPPLNLFGERTYGALVAAIDEVEGSGARCLVFRAEGKVFTGGVDVNLFQRALDEGATSKELFGDLLDVVRRVERLEIPTLSLVHSLCLTWGLELSLGFDLIWAAEAASFGLVERRVGLTPGAGGTQRMAERAGPARAREFVYTGRLYDAASMHEWGVVNRVLAGEAELLEKGMAFARQLAAGPTRAHAATKRIVRGFCEGGVEEADRVTPAVAGALFETDDLKRAVRTFLDEGPGKADEIVFEGR